MLNIHWYHLFAGREGRCFTIILDTRIIKLLRRTEQSSCVGRNVDTGRSAISPLDWVSSRRLVRILFFCSKRVKILQRLHLMICCHMAEVNLFVEVISNQDMLSLTILTNIWDTEGNLPITSRFIILIAHVSNNSCC